MVPEGLQFESVPLAALDDLREQQISALRSHVQESVEEGISAYSTDCVRLCHQGQAIGYACLSPDDADRQIILEYFVINGFRRHAAAILKQLARESGASGWLVNTQDELGLPVMLNLGLPYSIDAYIFVADRDSAPSALPCNASISPAGAVELSEIHSLVMQDGFYTGGGIESLQQRLEHGELYSLRTSGRLIGVGFISPLERTPEYADIAMIIDQAFRRQGWGLKLVTTLTALCGKLGLTPTAVCSAHNYASRQTLEGVGFRLVGCMLLCDLRPLSAG